MTFIHDKLYKLRLIISLYKYIDGSGAFRWTSVLGFACFFWGTEEQSAPGICIRVSRILFMGGVTSGPSFVQKSKSCLSVSGSKAHTSKSYLTKRWPGQRYEQNPRCCF